ncbi:efflux RND transporter permease subunit [Acinetobacter baumannii]|uniref:efflux RND transporter permease subunit n=1 Tax=Acinetobacter baumannii TaxID=470 RepID=UPI003877C9FC
MAALGITQRSIIDAIQKANQETGGSVLEMAETEYMVRASGYLKTLEDFRQIPLRTNGFGIPVTLGDVATIQLGPEMRRGISEYNGQGESVGGVIILRAGKNARETIAAAKEKLAELQRSLPKGVQIVPVYDRSQLIDRAVENLSHKLLEEFIVVALVCGLFLWHLRSAMVAIVSLPLGVLSAFLVMHYQGLNANIMSLGGIAIAIGAMVDAAVVMVENAHKHIEAWQHEHPDHILDSQERWSIIARSASEVGPALFFCLLIITLSFIPIFTLQAQEGRLFSPLAFTKNLCYGRGCWIIHYLDSSFDGLLDSWKVTFGTT